MVGARGTLGMFARCQGVTGTLTPARARTCWGTNGSRGAARARKGRHDCGCGGGDVLLHNTPRAAFQAIVHNTPAPYPASHPSPHPSPHLHHHPQAGRRAGPFFHLAHLPYRQQTGSVFLPNVSTSHALHHPPHRLDDALARALNGSQHHGPGAGGPHHGGTLQRRGSGGPSHPTQVRKSLCAASCVVLARCPASPGACPFRLCASGLRCLRCFSGRIPLVTAKPVFHRPVLLAHTCPGRPACARCCSAATCGGHHAED